MIKRWTHGHSLGAGALVGFGFASYRVWLIFAAGILLGAAAVTFWRFGRKLSHAVGRNVAHYAREQLKKEVRLRRAARRLERLQTDEIPW